jgi:hypothetical protein
MPSQINPNQFDDGQPVSKSALRDTLSTIKGEVEHGGFTRIAADAPERLVSEKLREVISVKDFGAKGDGVTDDKAALDAVGDYLRTLPLNSVVDVHWPIGDYKCFGRLLWTNCPNIRVYGHGSTLTNTQGAADQTYNATLWLGRPNYWLVPGSRTTDFDMPANPGTWNAGDLVKTVNSGDREVAFASVGVSANYDVGDSIFLYSEAFWDQGFPFVMGRFEWHSVKAVNTNANILTLRNSIKLEHRDDTTDVLQPGTGFSIGKARVINLTKRSVCDDIEVNDLTLADRNTASPYNADQGLLIAAAARSVRLNHLRAFSASPNQAEFWRMRGCSFRNCEPDKIVGRFLCEETNIESFTNGGTAVAHSEFRRCKLFGVSAQRSNWHEFHDCDLTFVSNSNQSYLNPFYAGAGRAGGTLVGNRISVPGTSFAQLGFRNGLSIGSGTLKGVFSNGFVPINDAGKTIEVSMPGSIASARDLVWPGRRFVAQKASGGIAFGRVISATLVGNEVTVRIACNEELLANGSSYPADWTQQWNIDGNIFVTNQLHGRESFQNFIRMRSDLHSYEVTFRPNLYHRIVPETSHIACFVEEYSVDINVPYTGADENAVFRLQIEEREIAGTATSSKNIDVSLRSTGRRQYGTGYAGNVLAGDTASGFTGGRIITRISFSGMVSEALAGSSIPAVMPDLTVSLKLRRLPDTFFAST